MATVKVLSIDGAAKADIELPANIFGAEVSNECIYLAVNAILTNSRQGTAKTKSKSEVSGGGTKPWKQKGTGRARAGSNTSPIWVRGGKAHGANPRDYFKKVNKKVKVKAFNSALTLKAQEEKVMVVDSLNLDAPKTKSVVAANGKLNIENQKNLFVVGPNDKNWYNSAKNIVKTKVVRVEDVNTLDVVKFENIIFSEESLKILEGGRK